MVGCVQCDEGGVHGVARLVVGIHFEGVADFLVMFARVYFGEYGCIDWVFFRCSGLVYCG